MALPLVKSTVDSIVSEFSKTIARLDNLRKTKLAEVDKASKVIADNEATRAAAQAEADRAEVVAGKIAALLS